MLEQFVKFLHLKSTAPVEFELILQFLKSFNDILTSYTHRLNVTESSSRCYCFYKAIYSILFTFCRYVPAALECSRDASGIEKSVAVSGGGFSFHDMFEHAHNLHPNGNDNGSRQHNQH